MSFGEWTNEKPTEEDLACLAAYEADLRRLNRQAIGRNILAAFMSFSHAADGALTLLPTYESDPKWEPYKFN